MMLMPFSLLVSWICIACSVPREGLGAADSTIPDSGSVIANFEGTQNSTTITCNVTNPEGNQVSTHWNLGNFRGATNLVSVNTAPELFKIDGDPIPEVNATYSNRITISNLTSVLDEVIVFCGTGQSPREASFTLRIYRPPNLRDNFAVKIEENSKNVPVDLSQGQEPAAFPEPTTFTWSKDGQPLTGFTTTYSTVMFSRIRRSDVGNYMVSATNFQPNSTELVGSDTGSFSLDVIYGPSYRDSGPIPQRYVLLGDRLSLVCGTSLDSNPLATITWTAPDGTTIVDNARYDLDNGPEFVRLNFTHTIRNDNGIWRCVATVRSDRYIVNAEGNLVQGASAVIGTPTQRDILLTVIVPPGPPHSLGVEDVGATWLRICWTPPLQAETPVTRYEVIARPISDASAMQVNISRMDNNTFVNVTELRPGTIYNLTVVAIIERGDVIARGPESIPFSGVMTAFTVPQVTCLPPESENGIITILWTYVHTGGLPLTDVTVQYGYEQGSLVTTRPVPNVGLNDMMAQVSNLLAGEEYTFNITAENANGSSSVVCQPINLLLGIPAVPQFGTITSGPGAGQITLQIRTVASGVDRASHGFRFVIIPVLDGINQAERLYDFPNYVSGRFESITVDRLEEGRSYTFSAIATNSFGRSGSNNSPSAFAGDPAPTQGHDNISPDSNAQHSDSGIVGGVFGGLLVISLLVILSLIFYIVFLKKQIKATQRASAIDIKDAVYADIKQPTTVNVIPMEACDAYGVLKATGP